MTKIAPDPALAAALTSRLADDMRIADDVAASWAEHLVKHHGQAGSDVAAAAMTLQSTKSLHLEGPDALRAASTLAEQVAGKESPRWVAGVAADYANLTGVRGAEALGESVRLTAAFGDATTAGLMLQRVRNTDSRVEGWTHVEAFQARLAWAEQLFHRHGAERAMDILDLARGMRSELTTVDVSRFVTSMHRAEETIGALEGQFAGRLHDEFGMDYSHAWQWGKVLPNEARPERMLELGKGLVNAGYPANSTTLVLARTLSAKGDYWAGRSVRLAGALHQKVDLPPEAALHTGQTIAASRPGYGDEAIAAVAERLHTQYGVAPKSAVARAAGHPDPRQVDDAAFRDADEWISKGLPREDALVWLSGEDAAAHLVSSYNDLHKGIWGLAGRWGNTFGGVAERWARDFTVNAAEAKKQIGIARGGIARGQLLRDAIAAHGGDTEQLRSATLVSRAFDDHLAGWERAINGQAGESAVLPGRRSHYEQLRRQFSNETSALLRELAT